MLFSKILINFWTSKLLDFRSYFIPTFRFIGQVIKKQIPKKADFCWGSDRSVRLSDDYGQCYILLKILGGGRNVDDQNVDRPKISEHRNGLFSWSERRNQNVENVFLVDQKVENE